MQALFEKEIFRLNNTSACENHTKVACCDLPMYYQDCRGYFSNIARLYFRLTQAQFGPNDIKFGVNIHSDKCYMGQCPDIS